MLIVHTFRESLINIFILIIMSNFKTLGDIWKQKDDKDKKRESYVGGE